MDFKLARQTFAVQLRTNIDIGQSVRTTTLDGNKVVLLDDISHFFSLSFFLCSILLQVSYAAENFCHATGVCASESKGANEGCTGVMERLWRRWSI